MDLNKRSKWTIQIEIEIELITQTINRDIIINIGYETDNIRFEWRGKFIKRLIVLESIIDWIDQR